MTGAHLGRYLEFMLLRAGTRNTYASLIVIKLVSTKIQCVSLSEKVNCNVWILKLTNEHVTTPPAKKNAVIMRANRALYGNKLVLIIKP